MTEVQSMSEAEKRKRGNVRVTEECYLVRGGCMLQALRGTSRSAALGRRVPSEMGRVEACAAPRGPVPGVCLHACTVELVRMVEVANFQLEARTNTDAADDWAMCHGRIAGCPGGPGWWERPQQLRGRSSFEMVRLKFYVNSR